MNHYNLSTFGVEKTREEVDAVGSQQDRSKEYLKLYHTHVSELPTVVRQLPGSVRAVSRPTELSLVPGFVSVGCIALHSARNQTGRTMAVSVSRCPLPWVGRRADHLLCAEY